MRYDANVVMDGVTEVLTIGSISVTVAASGLQLPHATHRGAAPPTEKRSGFAAFAPVRRAAVNITPAGLNRFAVGGSPTH